MVRSLKGFILIELVGFGATGEVWRARPDGGGPEVALKWLTDEAVDTDLLSAAELHEFEHPHVARLLDLRRDGPKVVLVHEFVAGVSLATLLTERDHLSGAEVVTLLTPVADALGAAHDAGLLHGNLSPTAVLVTPDGRPMLTDLGVWQGMGPTASGTARLEYLDPAVARGGPITSASDVFGLAAIGYHALTGRPPWTAGNAAFSWELAAEARGVDLQSLHASTPSPLADVIARGLSEQPRHRGSAQALAADVRAAVEPEPLHLAGPYVWPDLPPLEDDLRSATRSDASRGAAPSGAAPSGAAPMDIASEVRSGNSARHAAAPNTRRERDRARSATRSIGQDRPLLRHPRSTLAAGVVPRRAIVGALAALALVGVIVLGLGWNASKTVPAQAGGPVGAVARVTEDGASSADGGPTEVDELAVPDSPRAWVALLSLLYERRAVAFGTGATALLDQVFTADSPQLLTDTTELSRLGEAGQVLRGFSPRVLEVLEVAVDGAHATVQITDEFAEYETVRAVDTRAEALATHPGRGPAQVSMTLVLGEDGWRIHTAQRLG